MEAMLAKVELAMADTRERVDLIEQGMEKGLVDLREHIQDLREGMLASQVQPVSHNEFMSFQDKVMTMFASIKSRVEALVARMEARDQEAPRVEVPKPHTFSGKRDAKELDNFCGTWSATLRKNIKRLKHTSSIREYVKEFSMLMLEIPNMSEEKLLFNFMDNLQSWVEQELRRCGVQDLATTMAVVKSLVEYKMGDSSKPKPQSKGNHAKGGENKGSRGYTPKEGSSKTSSGKDGKCKDKQKELKPKTNYFLCDGPHWAQDCPKRKALNAMIEEKEKEKEGDAHMGSLQLLNALKAKPVPKTPQSKRSMYVEALDEAKRLELQASKEGGWLKAVNSTAKPSHEVARGVTMHIRSWEGKIDFIVAPMDDFKMVLGIDFLQKVKVVPLPFLRSMAILEKEKPCMVPTVIKGSPKTPMLSAIQVKKGLNRKEVTYLATLKEERDDGSGEPIPKEIEGVLDKFMEVMPPELPKRLPSRRDEDHKIGLE
ncbi:hypothetical protein CK203_103430 [Vitis vinifera]|uniref:Retrotransposon gag domain-containing protein n=1 Tax=Vitis vinifera TaxID=29760 RepID=A0A438BQQ3_VITVI|nr:hypothetical protein CK203_103430 [Vitis vinifera]